MFNYPELQAIPFKGLRFYETPDGKFYPSITTVLGGTESPEKTASLKSWQTSLGMDEAQRRTKEAADRGTAVHLLAERYFKKEPLQQPGESFNPTDVQAFNALKLKFKNVEEIWGQEVALYSDLLGIAGRTDLVGVYKGKPRIVDFKTSTRIKNGAGIEDYRLQLCAYAVMHNEMFGTDINDGVILMTSAGGFPQEFNVDLRDYVEALAVRVDRFYAEKIATLT